MQFFKSLKPKDPLNPDPHDPDDPYWGQRRGQDLIAGSILQIACMVIKEKDRNGSATAKTLEIDQKLSKATKGKKKRLQSLDPKYFWGREESGLPIGTIIHCARNLFAHYEESPYKRVRYVFDHLANTSSTGPQTFDLGIDRLIGNMVSANVIWRLGWSKVGEDNYQSYKQDMVHIANA